MLSNIDPREPRNNSGHEKLQRSPAARPAPDREVPLAGRRTPSTVHAWLDGELPEAAARAGGSAQDVDFWNRIEREVQTRRQVRTPMYVQKQIMDALPQTTPQVITSWWRRPLEITPMTAMAMTAALLTVGALVGAAILRLR
jgi:hypothetical protein